MMFNGIIINLAQSSRPELEDGLLERTFKISPESEEFKSLRAGFSDAQHSRRVNLWPIRNKGYDLRAKHDWSMQEAEKWIGRNQELYEMAYYIGLISPNPLSFQSSSDCNLV